MERASHSRTVGTDNICYLTPEFMCLLEGLETEEVGLTERHLVYLMLICADGGEELHCVAGVVRP